MCLYFKIIFFLLLVFNIQDSLQTDFLPVLEGLNIKSPYYIADKYDIQYKHLMKYHFQKHEPSMVLYSTKSDADIPKINKEKYLALYKLLEVVKILVQYWSLCFLLSFQLSFF